ncbi:MAG: hypothetical protein HYR56_04725 [Acidobacteria bacterium]|nr:hypothetical protein [Acidobacteriota bacterium]MBI3426021.1 hypothetical protein [Acidobacteriota bacterium]
MKTRKTPKLFLPLVALIALALAALSFTPTHDAAQQFSGAIYTSMSDASAVNHNIYDKCDQVYLNGGPQNQNGPGLPDGTYYFQVTTPNGDLLSNDPAACRQLMVVGGVIAGASPLSGACAHLNGTTNPITGTTPVRLFPFNATTNPGGEYKVWLIMQTPATTVAADGIHLNFSNSDTKTDNFKCKENPGGPQLAGIGGKKYYDTNTNGMLDANEPGIEGITIKVTLGDAAHTMVTTQTSATGDWGLALPVGTTYTACEMLPASPVYAQTGPKVGAQAFDGSNTLAATAQSVSSAVCWVGTVALTDTLKLDFFNVKCTQITCPLNVTVECGADTSPAATGSAVAVCATVTSSDSFAPACGATGIITRTWTATDSAGNTATCTQTITIQDTTKPTITGFPADTTVSCASAVPPANDAAVTATDCSAVTVTHDPDVISNLTCANRYTIMRTYHVTDACGNVTNRTQTITVNDTTGPTITLANVSTPILCPATPVFNAPTLSDNCGGAVSLSYADVTTNGFCGSYRITRTWTAKDACNNTSQASQSITVECTSCGGLTKGFWQNKNGQGIITGGAATAGVANAGTWLRQFAPFQDLSATATPAQVALYVYNVVKAATSAGTTMNPMLKAQMLATALDVYFSNPVLGGNKINAPAPLGNVRLDLTVVCPMLDDANGVGTCNGAYQNVSAVFGNATCPTVLQMLAYAASQSNSGGSNWYGQVKATQEMAKNAFDAINNSKAFACGP